MNLILKSVPRKLLKLIPKRCYLPVKYYWARVLENLEGEILLIGHLVNVRHTAIDIGANTGIWSYALSKLFARVEAFEPNINCTEMLRAYRGKNISIHDVALSSIAGFSDLHIPIIGGRWETQLATLKNIPGKHETIAVPTETLDHYNFNNVSFIKIDVEGHELEVLAGAEITIAREKPIMVIEIEQRHLTFPMDRVFDKIFSFGYEAFFISHGEIHPYAEFSYEIHQRPFIAGNFDLRNYVHNFIFRPRLC